VLSRSSTFDIDNNVQLSSMSIPIKFYNYVVIAFRSEFTIWRFWKVSEVPRIKKTFFESRFSRPEKPWIAPKNYQSL